MKTARVLVVLAALLLGMGLGARPVSYTDQVLELIAARNAALQEANWAALRELTVADSPARAADEELISRLATVRVESISTSLLAVRVVSHRGPILEVTTQQLGAHLSDSESSNRGVVMCRRWYLSAGKIWRIAQCGH